MPIQMPTTWKCLSTRWTTSLPSERGASLVEYALLVALIALVCIAAVTTLGTTTGTELSEISAELERT